MNAVVIEDLPIFYVPTLESNEVVEQSLPEGEAAHAVRVLRLSVGADIYVTNGKGSMYLCTLTEAGKRGSTFRISRQVPWQKYWSGRLTLAIAPTKSIERMEWLLEKAVEIGVDRIILLRTKHSERKHINAERLERIMLSAMKQSQKALLPTLHSEVTLQDALPLTEGDLRFVAHCRDITEDLYTRHTLEKHYKLGTDATIFIGPEGDFTTEEIVQMQYAGAYPTTLGESRLRSETAALAALQWLHTLQLISQANNNR